MDPRVVTSASELRHTFELSMALYEGMARLTEASERDGSGRGELLGLHRELSSLYNVLQGSDGVPTTQAVEAVRGRLATMEELLR